MNNTNENGNEDYLLDCPICGAIVDWCDCGKCHQIQCKACGMIVDNVRVGNTAETIEEVRAEMREWWNKRTSPRLVSYAPDGSTCTLNIDGDEHYYDRVGSTKPTPKDL